MAALAVTIEGPASLSDAAKMVIPQAGQLTAELSVFVAASPDHSVDPSNIRQGRVHLDEFGQTLDQFIVKARQSLDVYARR